MKITAMERGLILALFNPAHDDHRGQSHPSSASELSPLISAMTLDESMAFSV